MTTPAPPLILIVDDDLSLCEVLAEYFNGRGYATRCLGGPASIESVLREADPAIVILDRMLPGEDGVATCRRLRARSFDVPIILLTAVDGTIDRVLGLESGADDYVTKPFDPRELEARIATVLRRPRRLSSVERRIAFGEMVFDVELRVLWRKGVQVEITPREAALLAALLARPRQPLTRNELLDATGADIEHVDRAVDAAIYRLRRIVEDDPARPRYIRTLRGVGYAFHPLGGESLGE